MKVASCGADFASLRPKKIIATPSNDENKVMTEKNLEKKDNIFFMITYMICNKLRVDFLKINIFIWN